MSARAWQRNSPARRTESASASPPCPACGDAGGEEVPRAGVAAPDAGEGQERVLLLCDDEVAEHGGAVRVCKADAVTRTSFSRAPKQGPGKFAYDFQPERQICDGADLPVSAPVRRHSSVRLGGDEIRLRAQLLHLEEQALCEEAVGFPVAAKDRVHQEEGPVCEEAIQNIRICLTCLSSARKPVVMPSKWTPIFSHSLRMRGILSV